ncbi:hypothetical protein LUZ63_016529 [Rhynchospora breviuscula]|uniref:Uncharacterized protein n=1 Tax=Rhynchospora breviuscula TaxID=2022672 RepID=A0A9P9ZA30_9POAL|nr:hypothetical protein LUZ63_016529 [Rhynchospora breviuscula]
MAPFSEPEAHFVSLKATDISRDNLKFLVVIEVINLYDAPLTVSSAFYSLKISGIELVASQKLSCLIKVPKDTPTCVTIPIEVEEYEKYNFMKRHHKGDFDVEFNLTVEMMIEAQDGVEFKLQMAQSGPVEIPASRMNNEPDSFLCTRYHFLG